MGINRNFKITFALLIAVTASAVVAVDADIGATVEGQLVLGKRSFALPPGRWTVINSVYGNVTQGQSAAAATKRQYLVQIDEQNRLVATASVITTLASTATPRWNSNNCDEKKLLVNDPLDGRVDFPACLLIDYSTNFWVATPQSEQEKVTWNWFQAQKLVMPKTAVSVTYVKYFAGDYVVAKYWFNPELSGIAADGVGGRGTSAWNPEMIKSNPDHERYVSAVRTWSTSFISAYKASLFDNRPNVAQLPALPNLLK